MSVRQAQPEDANTYAQWLEGTEGNLLDRDVYRYPTAQHVVVEKDGQPQLMNSFHAVLVMEALAPRPTITPLQEARALNELFEQVKACARAAGIKEVMFMCADERLGKFIKGRGFEKLNHPCYRFKV